jgi:tartronate-semialdehyde synthase
MTYHVSLGFDNINSPDLEGYGVDHVKVAEGLGCKAIRVIQPDDLESALRRAQELARTESVPVVVEVILEKVTNISMGAAGLDAVNEFEPLAISGEDAPTAISVMDSVAPVEVPAVTVVN